MTTATSYLLKQGEQLFSKRYELLSLWQCLADNFYPERADFTTTRSLGDEFASHLSTSYPVLARRDLGNSFGGMLRPTSKKWFNMVVKDRENDLGVEAKAYVEWVADVMRSAMYDRVSMFIRATKEGDHDFATFGQTVLSCEMNHRANALLYRNWHLRDVAWVEDDIGQVGTVYRKWKPTALTLKQVFGSKCHPDIATSCEKDPYKEFDVWHCVVPTETYPDIKLSKHKAPFISVFVDVKNKHIIEETPVFSQYVIPRWQTVSGSQYSYSPATIVALPDARLIQAMTYTLLEAGEKAVTPPMLATQEAIRGDISVYAGGITWVDSEYDERLGEVLRPLTQDRSGIPLGMEQNADTRNMIKEAFFLNKLALPSPESTMTAYETGQRVQEYIRQALPLFEPMEQEYNGALCNVTYETLQRNGAFGSPDNVPKELHGVEFSFEFESPLREATDREKGQRFLEAKSMLAASIALDPGAIHLVDVKVALRDVLEGIGVPAKWTRSEAEVSESEEAQAQAQEAQETLAMMEKGSGIAKDLAQSGMVQ